MKKTLALVLATMMLLSMFVFSSCEVLNEVIGNPMFDYSQGGANNSQQDEEYRHIEYQNTYALNEDGQTYRVVGVKYDGCTRITVPDVYNGKPVTAVGGEGVGFPSILFELVIGKHVKSIDANSFYSSNVIAQIKVDEENKYFTSIDGSLYTKDKKTLVMYACDSSTTSFTVPDSVTTIGDYAFTWNEFLETIYIGESVTSIGKEAFSTCNRLKAFEVDQNNPCFKSVDGVLYSKDGTELIQYPGGNQEETFFMPDGVKVIRPYAFNGYQEMKYIVFPESLTEIGDYAFGGSYNLSNITIPATVTVISDSAFWSCPQLKICCEAESKPEGWVDGWNNFIEVHWGCKGD